MNDNKLTHLLIVEDLQGKRTIELEAATYSIGRDSSNSIVLDSHMVSRQHAILLRVTMPETATYLFRIIDGNLQGKRSTNGLTINGKSCFSHDLGHGDAIVFGGDVKARYYATSDSSFMEFLSLCPDEDLSGFLSNLSNPFKTYIGPEIDQENSSDAALVRLASFPELISNPILEITMTGMITYLNPAAVAQFPDIREADIQHPILAGLIAAIENGQEKFFVREVEIAEQVFEQSVHYIAESELIRIYIVDITERKRTEAALRSSMLTNRALINAIPDLMLRISKDGTFVNFKASESNNWLAPSMDDLGKNLFEVFPQEIATSIMDCVQKALATGEIQILEYQLTSNDNSRDFEARFFVSAEDEVIAIVRDITERKQAEADIRNALEKEKQLSELKSRFVTMASHEFRTPLTTILSSAELLQDYCEIWTQEKKFQHLNRIVSAVSQMNQLLEAVLLIGKAEAGKLDFNPAPIDVVQFCRDLVDEIQIISRSHSITFQCQDECIDGYMDERLLRHIFINLLSNAIKYSPQGGIVNFDLICENSEAIFCIQDRGIGIPEADQTQLFDAFHRASNVSTISGTGLGLSIVKQSVELHGGKIAVSSQVGVGTTFTVTLPLKRG